MALNFTLILMHATILYVLLSFSIHLLPEVLLELSTNFHVARVQGSNWEKKKMPVYLADNN